MGLRDTFLALAPPWLSDPQTSGGKFLYTMGLVSDLLLDKCEQALLARMPGALNPTALPLIGEDRLLPRGPGESERQYGTRLRQAFSTWQRAGINSGVLRQVLGFLEAYAPRARIVSDYSQWASVAPGTDYRLPASYFNGNGNWNWDNYGDPHPVGENPWWRWWLILYSTATSGANWAGTPRKWGEGKWGDTAKAWGVGISSATFKSIRAIIGQSKRAGSWCRWLVISLDDDLFVPTAALAIDPAGSCGHWSKTITDGDGVTRRVAARPANARFADGWASTGATLQADWPNY